MIENYSQQVKYKSRSSIPSEEGRLKREHQAGQPSNASSCPRLAFGDFNNDGRIDVLIATRR